MRPFLVGIGGAHSGCGKTWAACRILRMMRGWGALKCSPSGVYSSVSDEPGAHFERGKDTALMAEAGSVRTLFVRSTPEDMAEALWVAMDGLSGLGGAVVEGNSAIEVLRPDIVIFISGDADRFKKGAEGILRMADVVVFRDAPPSETPENAAVFQWEDQSGFLDFVARAIDERRAERGA